MISKANGTVGSLLTKKQMNEVQHYIDEQITKNINPLDPKFADGLKALLKKYENDLEKKGVYSDYLAYYIIYTLIK